uniref:small monomeric GTPase n=1 Tax=Oryzias latipes TaxID=8090 RepID=A0A3P9JZ02_ORYLA
MSGILGKGKPGAECNLVLLGVTGCGKSALTVRFLTKRFIGEYDPCLEDIYTSEEIVDQQLVTVRVMDTCDQVSHINNVESFHGCQLYLQILSSHNKTFRPQTPIILLGNKLDMDRYRQVSQCDAEALATRFGCLFFEVSACRDFESVQHVFYEAVRRSNRGTERGGSVGPMFVEAFVEDKALNLPSFYTPCYKELPAPATAKLVTVKTSRAQSKRRATTFTLLKGFKIF